MPDTGGEASYRRIAWDRVSFEVPAGWELASYRWPRPGMTRIELEDDYSVCLNGQWQWSEDEGIMENFLKGMEERDGDLARRADHKQLIEDLPANWSAYIYSFSKTVPDKTRTKIDIDKTQIFHVNYMIDGFAASFQIQSSSNCPQPLEKIGQHFIQSFQLHKGEIIPWELFDIAIEMPRSFELLDAQFSIGSKLLIFEKEKRKLNLWILSCADVILKDAESLEKWACGFLNSQGRIRSMVFKPDASEGIRWKRRFPMVITHRREIGAWCFRWQVKVSHQKATNRIMIMAYNYRREDDLNWLPEWLNKALQNAT